MNRNRKQPYVTYTVLVLCIAVFALVQFCGLSNKSEAAILLGAFYKPFILAGEWFRFLTAGFVHVNAMHIIVNSVAFINLGTMLENRIGRLRYLAILLVSIITGSLFIYVGDTNVIAVGLSGGLYGLMACVLWIVYRSGVWENPQVRNSLIRTIVINLGINLIPGVAWLGHLGGAVGGFILTLILVPDMQTGKINKSAIGALAALAVCIGIMIPRNSTIPEEERYIGSDINVLVKENDLGLGSHAEHMAEKLDDVYGTGQLVWMYYVSQVSGE